MIKFFQDFKKVFGIFLLIAISCIAIGNSFQVDAQNQDSGSQLAQSPRVAEIRKSGKLIVAISAPYEPAIFADPGTGKWVGFDAEIATAIAAKIGVPIEWKNIVFEDLLSTVKAGKADIAISSITIRPDRQKELDFSEGYFKAGLSLVVNRCNKSVVLPKDLKNRKVGATKGTVSAKYIQKLQQSGLEVETKEFKGEREMITALRDGDIDAAVNGSINSKVILTRASDLKAVGELLEPEFIGIALKKGDRDLLNIVNAIIQEMRSSGKLGTTLERWMNASSSNF